MSGDPNKKSPRTFMCRDALWERFEQMARELECSVDYLINDAMKQYARQRNYATDAGPPSAGPPPMQRDARERDGRDMGGYRPASMPPGIQQSGGASRLPPPPQPGAGRSQLPAPPPSRAASNLPPPAAPPPTRTLGNMAGGLPAPPPTRAAYAQTMQSRMQPTPGQAMPRQEYPQQASPSHAPLPNPPHVGSGRSVPPPPLPNGGYNAPAASAQLTVIYNGERIAVAKDRFVVGRGKQSSDLTLKDPNVSRQHAMIEFQNGAYFMVDMGSTNGVEFNGQRIARKQIAEGDIFRICDHEIRFTFR